MPFLRYDVRPEPDNFNFESFIRCVLCLILHGVDDLCENSADGEIHR